MSQAPEYFQSDTHLSPWATALPQERHSYELAIVMQSILNPVSSTSPFPQPRVVGIFYSGGPLLGILLR